MAASNSDENEPLNPFLEDASDSDNDEQGIDDSDIKAAGSFLQEVRKRKPPAEESANNRTKKSEPDDCCSGGGCESYRNYKVKGKLAEIWAKEDAEKRKRAWFGGLFHGKNLFIFFLLALMMGSLLIPLIEMLSRSPSSTSRPRYTPSPTPTKVKEPTTERSKYSHTVYTTSLLKAMSVKELKTLLWVKSQPISDLYEKRQIIKRIIENIVKPDLAKMTESQIKSELKKVGQDDKDFSHITRKEELINYYVEL